MSNRLIIVWWACFTLNLASSQNIIIGGGPTISTYFGDLAPYSLKQSFSQLKPGIGFYASKRLIDPIYFEMDMEFSQVSADDKDQTNEGRKSRNLSFKSPIASLSALIGLRLGLLKDKKAGITGGLGITGFTFDPQAKIDGQWHRLQPLRTEGQGLPGSMAKEYSLTQFALAVQGGVFLRINEKLYFDVELTQYFTSTDYLDDVSSEYYDADLLRQYVGDLAVRLADRHTMLLAPGAPNFPAGTHRGNPKKNDQFAYIKFGLSYALDKNGQVRGKRVKCPQVSKEGFEK